MDLLEKLLDEKNNEDITLKNEEGKDITFEQVAVIPYGDNLYCVLKPLTEIEGVSDDEAIVFRVDQQDGESVLAIEEDEAVAMQVFEEYINLWEAQNGDEEGEGADDRDD